tara:strand:- start:319 stop:585 length:267 start_codon:yes stop_codon:yes gene_type:complete
MSEDVDIALLLLNIKYNTTEVSTNTMPIGSEMLGYRVEIYWPTMKKWYPATIVEYSVRLNCPNEPNYHIEYDDGEDEWVHLNKNVRII